MVVVSREDADAPRTLTICAPITTSDRGSKYEVEIGKPKFLREFVRGSVHQLIYLLTGREFWDIIFGHSNRPLGLGAGADFSASNPVAVH